MHNGGFLRRKRHVHLQKKPQNNPCQQQVTVLKLRENNTLCEERMSLFVSGYSMRSANVEPAF